MKGSSAKPGQPSLNDLKPYFHLPLRQAAAALRIGVTTFKKRCRIAGLEKWPYKKPAGKTFSSSSSWGSLGSTPKSGSPPDTCGQEAECRLKRGGRAAGDARGQQAVWGPPPHSPTVQQGPAMQQRPSSPAPPHFIRGLDSAPGGNVDVGAASGQWPGLQLQQQSLPQLRIPNGGPLQALHQRVAAVLLAAGQGWVVQGPHAPENRGSWQQQRQPEPRQQKAGTAASSLGWGQHWAPANGLSHQPVQLPLVQGLGHGQEQQFARPAPSAMHPYPPGPPAQQLAGRRLPAQGALAEALLGYVQAQASQSSIAASLFQSEVLQAAELLARAGPQHDLAVGQHQPPPATTASQPTQQFKVLAHAALFPDQQQQQQQQQGPAKSTGPGTVGGLSAVLSGPATDQGHSWRLAQALPGGWSAATAVGRTAGTAAGLPPYTAPGVAALPTADPLAVGVSAALAGDTAVVAAAAASVAGEDRQHAEQAGWGPAGGGAGAEKSKAALLRLQAKIALELWMAGQRAQG